VAPGLRAPIGSHWREGGALAGATTSRGRPSRAVVFWTASHLSGLGDGFCTREAILTRAFQAATQAGWTTQRARHHHHQLVQQMDGYHHPCRHNLPCCRSHHLLLLQSLPLPVALCQSGAWPCKLVDKLRDLVDPRHDARPLFLLHTESRRHLIGMPTTPQDTETPRNLLTVCGGSERI